ncbi:MAG: hypothetical protein IPH75_13555 [bacterium]|nr:hypothetical protein [bacterium]
MHNRSFLTGCLVLVLAVAASAATRPKGQVERVQPSNFITLQAGHMLQSFTAAEACTAASIDEIVYRMDGWVIGNELYKALIDPAADCASPYPYTVTAVNMPMIFDAATTVTVAVDIEEAVTLTGGCRVPGNMLAISSDYTVTVPAAGYYNIWIPLDEPIAMDEPFFAGFFIGSTLTVGAAIVIDDNPQACHSYNIWDTTVGFVDLCNFPPEFGSEYNFPGRLAMEVAGITGGSGGNHPAPAISLLSPVDGSTLMGSSEVWADETSGSEIIDYVSFEYLRNGVWTEFGRDYDGTGPLRSGVAAAEAGNGYSVAWNFSSVPEGAVSIRARAVDTLGREASAQIAATLEPTPPIARIISPDPGDDFCSPLSVLMQSTDENLTGVQLFMQHGALNYSSGLTTLHQQMLGDVNGNGSDGNSIANGEFGNYYSGPAVGAIAAKKWYDRGFTTIMRSGFTTLTMVQVAESLAVLMQTRANLGTTDELLFSGLKQYAYTKGDEFDFGLRRSPNYWQLRTWVEEEQRVVMLGLGGMPSYWVAVDGFAEWEQPDGSFKIVIANPVNSGAPQTVSIRVNGPISEVYVNGSWHTIDIAISMTAKGWSPTREAVGMDLNGANGWSVNWVPEGLSEDNLYFFRSVAVDATSLEGYDAILVNYSCEGTLGPGDYDGDGSVNLSDLSLLILFLTDGGTPPSGGSGRADANCDGVINIGDIVYYMNFLLGNAGAPCY